MKNLKTVSESLKFTRESLYKTEIVKSTINGMLFKISCDVHNGGNYWTIYVWSNATFQWNILAGRYDIPELKSFQYFECYNTQKNEIHPYAKWNFIVMKEFINTFVDNLQA